MALFMVLFASCSQEEIVSTATGPQGNGLVTVSVNMPQEGVISRAMPSIDGYTRRCIMQVVDSEGTAIEGTDMRQVKEVTGETVSFSFTAPDGEYNVLFWADYVNGSINTDYLYTTTDLTNITQKMSRYHMFQDYADAFCGCMKGGETSITLKRPFSRLEITSEAVAYAGYNQIQIGNITVPDGYNVFDKTTSGTTPVRLASLDSDPTFVDMRDAENGVWAYLYVFAPVNAEAQTLSLSITLHDSTGTIAEDQSITATSSAAFAWDENMHIYFDVPEGGSTPGGDTEVTVDVNFGEGYGNDPVVPTLQVGAYVNAAGEPVATAAEAAGVVFAMGALGTDVPANYPSALQGKTIAAYAVALENAGNRARIKSDEATFPTLTQSSATAGITTTGVLETVLTGFDGSPCFNNYHTWVGENALEGENVSDWFIPSFTELTTLLDLIMPAEGSVNVDLQNKLQESFNTTGSQWYFLSSTINANLRFSAAIVTGNADSYSYTTSQADPTGTAQACIRPMFTIFE